MEPTIENVKFEKPQKNNTLLIVIGVVLALLLCCCCLGMLGFVLMNGDLRFSFGTAVVPAEQAPVEEAKPADGPEITIDLPKINVEVPSVPLSCMAPSIMTSLDGVTFKEVGEYLNTELGERMTRTTRLDAEPNKAWNDPLSPTELKNVEQTVVFFRVCVPEGMSGRIETGGLYQGNVRYDNGATLTLDPGYYEFKLRNGAIVIWYPGQEKYAATDLKRIITEDLLGNFDIKHSLAAHGVTKDLEAIFSMYFTDIKVIPNLVPSTK